MKNKANDKIRPIGNRKPFNGGYIGKTNGQLSDDYQKDKSFPTNLFSYNSRTAITYHGIKVCHSCMEFLKKLSELNGRTWEEEISYQTKRLS